jgi:hypothetical protein
MYFGLSLSVTLHQWFTYIFRSPALILHGLNLSHLRLNTPLSHIMYTHTHTYIYIYIYVSGGIVNMLGGGSMDYSE